MTEPTNPIRRLRASLLAAGAALALSGCAATHVGDDWRCPLAQGSQCTSVATADPAVKPAAGAERPARPAPRHRARGAAGPARAGGTAGDCAGGCNPFAWLARLFGADDTAAGKHSPQARGDGAAADSPDGTSATAAAAAVGPVAEDLRAPETVGRIWIAPWVDSGGVYREASWVRIVLVPADWKRP